MPIELEKKKQTGTKCVAQYGLFDKRCVGRGLRGRAARTRVYRLGKGPV